MSGRPAVRIGERTYVENPRVNRYQIPLGELGDLRMMDIPAHSHVEIIDIPAPECAVSAEVFGVNGGGLEPTTTWRSTEASPFSALRTIEVEWLPV